MTSLPTSGRKLSRKAVENAASHGFDGISREQFTPGSQKFYQLIGAIGLTNLPDTTSLDASGRLQNAIDYCTKVRETGPAGQRVEYLANI